MMMLIIHCQYALVLNIKKIPLEEPHPTILEVGVLQ